MSTHEDQVRGELLPEAGGKPFRMIAIFDSETASAEAASASELVVHQLGEDIEVDESAWDVQSLESAELRAQAAEQAAHSDVIVLALAMESPSAELRAWIDQWLKTRQLAGGLLALIPSGNAATGGELAEYLYETAVSANMDFLCRKHRRYQLG